MKPLRKHLKPIALFLAVTFLVQSCKVYTYKATTVDAAINTDFKEVKVKSNNGETYRFDKLEEKDGVYYAIAKKNSKIAKKLVNQITYKDEFKYVKILLNEEQLGEVYLREHDKKLYTILAIGISVLMVGGIIWIDSLGGVGIPSY